MVYRVYVEKKEGCRNEADAIKKDITALFGLKTLTDFRVINRYDVEGVSRELFDYAVKTVFSEPQTDEVFYSLDKADNMFAAEFLPGQFDQRADSAAQCIQMISKSERPLVRTAKIYVAEGCEED